MTSTIDQTTLLTLPEEPAPDLKDLSDIGPPTEDQPTETYLLNYDDETVPSTNGKSPGNSWEVNQLLSRAGDLLALKGVDDPLHVQIALPDLLAEFDTAREALYHTEGSAALTGDI